VSGQIVQKALEYWRAGHPLEVGILVFERIPRASRLLWSAAMLRMASEHISPSSEINAVLEFAGNPDKWGEGKAGRHREAHLIVDAVNDLHYQTEELLPKRVFTLAKDVAKVIYNARWYPAPFDHSAGWQIAEDLEQIINWIKDEEFAKRAWMALCDERLLTLSAPTLCCPGCPVCLALLAQNSSPDHTIAEVGETHLSANDILRIAGFSV
jgi:hypothetical protein